MADPDTEFTLRKWYLDVADPHGNGYIGYWASVRWKAITLHFYQHLFFSPTGSIHTAEIQTAEIQTESGFTKQPEPAWATPARLVWQTGDLRAEWHSQADPIDQVLYQSDRGSIRWHCTQPKAAAEVHRRDRTISGWGYSEWMELSVPVWQLPLHTLYWGRAHAAGQHAVWIAWEGEVAQRYLWRDGGCSSDFSIDEQGLTYGAQRLHFGATMPLRRGQLGQTLFKPFRALLARFPVQILQVDEQKYYSRGLFEQAGTREEATLIYEKVTF